MQRFHFAIWNYFTSVAAAAGSMILALVTAPLLLTWLGQEKWGAYRVLIDVISYLAFMELGLGTALTAILTAELGKGDLQRQRQTVALGFRTYAILACIAIIVGIGAWPIVRLLIRVEPTEVNDLWTGYVFMLATMALLPLHPIRLYLQAAQRSYLVNAAIFAQMIFIMIGALVFAYGGFGIKGQAGAFLVGQVAAGGVMVCCFFRAIKGWHTTLWREWTPADLRQCLWSMNRPGFVLNMCGQLSLMTDNIIISSVLGPAAVIPFFLTQRLALLAQSQLQGFANASWAGLADMHVKGHYDTFNQRLIELTKSVTVVGVAVLLPIVVFNQAFISLWVGEVHFAGSWLTAASATNALLMALITVWSMTLSGLGVLKPMAFIFVAQTLINFILSVVLTWYVGSIGPLLGTLVSFIFVTIWCLPLLLRAKFGTSISGLARAVLLPIGLGVLQVPVWLWVARTWPPSNWCGLALDMIAALAFHLSLAAVLAYGSWERQLWKDRLRSLFASRHLEAAHSTET